MSDFDNATASKRARTSAAILIVALIAFSAVAIAQSNLLPWPLASELQSLGGHVNSSKTNQNNLTNSYSVILVSAIAYLPAIGQNCPGLIELPLSGANVTVFLNATLSLHGRQNAKGLPVAFGVTGPNGQASFKVPEGKYLVTMKSNIVNLSASLSTELQNTTELDIQVNETSYTVSYFEIQNAASPSLLLPWENTFLRLNSTSQTNAGANRSVYLRFLRPNSSLATFNSTGFAFGSNVTVCLFPVFQDVSTRLISEFSSASQGALWLEVQTNSVVNITDISGIDVLISSSTYALREYPTANQSAEITTSNTST